MPQPELPIIQKTYDLLMWLIPKIEKFPRTQKYVLGDRIEVALLDFLRLVVHASKKKDKLILLDDADAKLLEIRYLVRLSVDLKYISASQYEFASAGISELGAMLGGWIKQIKSRAV